VKISQLHAWALLLFMSLQWLLAMKKGGAFPDPVVRKFVFWRPVMASIAAGLVFLALHAAIALFSTPFQPLQFDFFVLGYVLASPWITLHGEARVSDHWQALRSSTHSLSAH
jgi:hypothetical protein